MAIVTTRWDGMRWTRAASALFFAPDEALSAYGEVVWSWRRDAGAKPVEQSAGDGDNKPAHRGERDISRKAIAQGMSVCSPLPCMLVCAFVCATGTRDRGCSAHPAFPAPSVFEEGQRICKTSGKTCSEIADARHSGARETRARNP